MFLSIGQLNKLHNIGLWSLCGMALSMTVSRALFNVFALLMVLIWLISGQFRKLPSEARQSPVILMCLLLYGWILIGVTYSAAPVSEALDQVSSYSKLLLIPVMASFISRPREIKMFWLSVAASFLLLQISYLADLWIDIPGSRSSREGGIGVFNNYIVEGLSLTVWALTMVAASVVGIQNRKWFAVPTVGLASLAIYTVLFLNPGRGAHLALLASLVLLLLMVMPSRTYWTGMALACLLIGSVAFQSTMLKQRFQQAANEAKTAHTLIQSSVGLRINAWQAGLEIWRSSPVIGRGAGSYKHLMNSQHSQMVGGCAENPVCLQPHSQYVLLLAEQGAVGLLLFLGLLGALVKPLFVSSHISIKLSVAFACAFAVHSAFDSGLRMGTQMFVFMVMTVALISATKFRWPEQLHPSRFSIGRRTIPGETRY